MARSQRHITPEPPKNDSELDDIWKDHNYSVIVEIKPETKADFVKGYKEDPYYVGVIKKLREYDEYNTKHYLL